ncbi:hypothetical protein [Candidatus Avelusimicrobium gallicola]|nr:hypothetical protein [Elusimicrobium sp. An273]
MHARQGAAAALLFTAGMSPKPKKQETQVMKKAPIDTIFNQGEPNPYTK